MNKTQETQKNTNQNLDEKLAEIKDDAKVVGTNEDTKDGNGKLPLWKKICIGVGALVSLVTTGIVSYKLGQNSANDDDGDNDTTDETESA